MSDVDIELSKAALVDSIRDEIIKALKDLPSAWGKLDEKKQRYFIELAADVAKKLARGACDIVAADGRSVLDCTIGKVGINETTLEAKISVPRDKQTLIAFGGAAHGPAVLSFVNYEKHTSEDKRPDADPDQRAMFSNQPVAMSEVMDQTVTKLKPAVVKEVPDPDPAAIAEHMAAEDKPKSPSAAKKAPRKRTTRSSIKAGRNGKSVDVIKKQAPKEDVSFSLVEDD